jgi:hypothetical protein
MGLCGSTSTTKERNVDGYWIRLIGRGEVVPVVSLWLPVALLGSRSTSSRSSIRASSYNPTVSGQGEMGGPKGLRHDPNCVSCKPPCVR